MLACLNEQHLNAKTFCSITTPKQIWMWTPKNMQFFADELASFGKVALPSAQLENMKHIICMMHLNAVA